MLAQSAYIRKSSMNYLAQYSFNISTFKVAIHRLWHLFSVGSLLWYFCSTVLKYESKQLGRMRRK